jgi:hypothetical protein
MPEGQVKFGERNVFIWFYGWVIDNILQLQDLIGAPAKRYFFKILIRYYNFKSYEIY